MNLDSGVIFTIEKNRKCDKNSMSSEVTKLNKNLNSPLKNLSCFPYKSL